LNKSELRNALCVASARARRLSNAEVDIRFTVSDPSAYCQEHTTQQRAQREPVAATPAAVAAMADWARKNQTEFYRLYARLIPSEFDD
jgi:hypothetical protein